MPAWYWKLEHLKRGGFADVYRACDVNTRQIVAVKELRNPTAENCQRFKREASILIERVRFKVRPRIRRRLDAAAANRIAIPHSPD